MISTGIVRSIDSLGRVVLPKELRTTYDITRDFNFNAGFQHVRFI